MLKVSLSTKKTPSHLSDYCVSVTLSFPETACLIQPDLAESILISHSSALSRSKFKPDWTNFGLLWETCVKESPLIVERISEQEI